MNKQSFLSSGRVFVLIFALLLCLSGCAKANPETENGGASSAASQEQESAPSRTEEEPSEAPAADARLLREENYSDGALSAYTDYLYDEAGKLIRKKFFTAAGTLDFEKEYLYNEKEQLIAEQVIRDGEVSGKSTHYEYDQNGNCVREITAVKISEDEVDVSNWDEYSYDTAGRKIRCCGWRKGKLSYEYDYTYDADSNLTKEVHLDAEGKVTLTEETQYDAAGHILKTVTRRGDTETVTEYDWSENFTKRGTTAKDLKGNPDGAVLNTYDEFGRLILSERYRLDGTVANSIRYIFGE